MYWYTEIWNRADEGNINTGMLQANPFKPSNCPDISRVKFCWNHKFNKDNTVILALLVATLNRDHLL